MRTQVFCVLLVSLIGLAVTLAGCEPAPAAINSPTPASITVTDALGRTVSFTEPPQRIAIAGKAFIIVADAVYLFPEAKTRVVACGRNTQSTAGEFLTLVDPAYAQKTLYDVSAGPEQIAPARPDVVVLKSYMQDQLGKPLEQVGIPVVYVDLETPAQYERDLVTLGQLFGNEARAKEVQAIYKTRLDRIAQGVAGLNDAQKPRVLVLQASEKGGTTALSVPPASWIQTSEVELAGGIPVWKDAAQGGGWITVNLEQIAAWNPDQVFVISYAGDPTQAAAKLKADSQWQGLKAVKDGQVYGFPKDYYSWDQSDPRWILGLTWLAGKVQPGRFTDLDITTETIQFFQQAYGLDEATIKTQILTLVQGDLK